MDSSEQTINTFTTRVRQMILRFQELTAQNRQLRDTVKERDERISLLEKQLAEANNNYQTLKTARMLQVSDSDSEAAKKKMAALIRDVNKCITLLSGK